MCIRDRAQSYLVSSRTDQLEGEAVAALRLGQLKGGATADMLPAAFVAAMLDDFGMPQALAALHGAVRAGNIAIDEGDEAALLERAAEVVAMLDVLGLDPRDPIWRESADAGSVREQQALATLIDLSLIHI